jgi:16S rRNA (cytosine967-C5)-methyltransferase
MKLYKNLVNSVAETLQEIFIKNRYADKAIERLFKQHTQWGSRDRRFVAEAVYDIVRNYRLYSELARSPKNFWFITAVWLVDKGIELPAWPEFQHVDPAQILKAKEKLVDNPVIRESYPDWLWALGISELGKEKWATEAIAMNQQAPVVLRANTLKTSREKLQKELQADGIETKHLNSLKDALELTKRANVFQNKYFKEGWFEVQDAGSQKISEFVSPSSNDFVVDACAGAGGKTLHLAALMNNRGRIVSMDVEQWKLDELKKRAKRAGAQNVETAIVDETIIKKFNSKCDKLLLDVPCSGLGVIKRNPDAKWKLTADVIEKTRQIQFDILSRYSAMVKPGGSVFYCTCSILPSENEQQVKRFLESSKEFEFVRDRSIYPSEGYDGFYMSELRRKPGN